MLLRVLMLTVLCVVHAQNEADVLILGAGAAGLEAAKYLHGMNVSFIIIEGDSWVGGRVKTVKFNGMTVEDGCAWLQADNGTLMDITSKNNLTGTIVDYEDVVVRTSQAQTPSAEADVAWERLATAQTTVKDLYRHMKEDKEADMSIRVALENGNWFPKTPVEDVIEIYDYDSEMSKIPALISTKGFEGFSEDGELIAFSPSGEEGLEKLIKSTADGFLEADDPRLKLNEIVNKIAYTDDSVTVSTNSGKNFTGKYAIVTFSMGVLKSRSVVFEPALPDWKKDTIFRTSMDAYSMVYAKFDTNVWESERFILHANPRRGYYPLLENLGSDMISFDVYGQEARRVERADNMTVKAELEQVMRDMYAIRDLSITSLHVTKWLDNPLAMGSFSSRQVGDNNEHFLEKLQSPVHHVYFAGEAYDDHFDGSLIGALTSGQQTARKLYKCMQDNKCDSFDPNPPPKPTQKPETCGAQIVNLKVYLAFLILAIQSLF